MRTVEGVRAAKLDAAFRFCRGVAKREAKNFYYSFRVLPKPKRDAMCAVYAFMRRADDLADDEAQTVAERRVMMAEWLERWRASRAEPFGIEAGSVYDPVFCALAETQRRFGIGDELLEQLVQGTTMDLEPGAEGAGVDLGGGLQGYETFRDLYRYCYLVASVVGLVTIKIFGYSEPRAELLAEETGIAFQLTNILRDIKEDAERGRIYLPQELLREFGVTNADVVAVAGGRQLRANERAMITALGVQASEYYGSAWKLLPLIERDSRGALYVLVAIYNRLLRRIEAEDGDVFSMRVRVPTWEKLSLLVKGAVKRVVWRERRRQ